MTDISIETYSPKYKEGLLDLLSYHLDDLNFEERKKRFEWMYEDNPYTESPLCYLALDREKVVGHCGSIVQKFQLTGKEYYFCTPADAIVHPEYRRKGIFSSLLKFSRKELALNSNITLILILSANKTSTPIQLKYGDESVGKRRYMYYFSFTNILKFFLRKYNFQKPISFDKNDLKIKITNELRAQEISNLMNKCKEKNKITNTRDKAFYEWRFSNPLKEYLFGYCTKDDELVGYIALENNEEKIIPIMEYGYLKPYYLEELNKEIFKNLTQPCFSVFIFTRSNKEREIISKIGFRDNKDLLVKLLKKINIMSRENLPGAFIKPSTENITEEDFFLNGKDVRNPNNWSLFYSDVH